MNNASIIHVKTATGISRKKEIGECIGQGTVGGALLSSLNLDSGVQQFFKSSSSEASYADVRLGPLIFQDDLARICLNVQAAQAGNDKVETITNLKQLEINIDKSSYILLGNKNKVEDIRRQIKETPLSLNGNTINERDSEKYLGDYIHSNGNEQSTLKTINERYWRAMSAILEINTIIEDCRINSIGGIMTGIDIWEMAVIPMLLNNAGTWDNVNEEALKKLNKLQNSLMRYMLKTPRTTPIPSLSWEFGVLPMKYRILLKKLSLTKHILNLDNDALAKQIFNSQNKFNFPGLAKETNDIIRELQLPNIVDEKTNEEWPKRKWKRKIKEKIIEECEIDLKNEIKKLEKLQNNGMETEHFETKEYLKTMTVEDARIKFKLRTKMLNTKFNYKNEPANRGSLWLCHSCQSSIETQSHVLWCPAYAELREGKDIYNDNDLIEYIKKVLELRDKLKISK